MAEQSLPSIELPLERPAAEDAAVDLLARVFGAAPAALQRMKDGITNVVLCATFAADCAADRAREAHTVLIRIYGKNTEVGECAILFII